MGNRAPDEEGGSDLSSFPESVHGVHGENGEEKSGSLDSIESLESDSSEGEDLQDDETSLLSFRVPDDILGLLLEHISSFSVFLNYFFLCKSFHYYVTRLNPSCCSHIRFNVYEMPDSPVEYVRRVKILSRIQNVRPRDNSSSIDFLQAAYFLFQPEIFPNLEELAIESSVVVIPNQLSVPAEEVLLRSVKKITLKADRGGTVAVLWDESDWDRIHREERSWRDLSSDDSPPKIPSRTGLTLFVRYPCRTKSENDIFTLAKALDSRIEGNVWKRFRSLECLKVKEPGIVALQSIAKICVAKLREFVFRDSPNRFARTTRTGQCWRKLLRAPCLEEVCIRLRSQQQVFFSDFLRKVDENAHPLPGAVNPSDYAINSTLRHIILEGPGWGDLDSRSDVCLQRLPSLKELSLSSTGGVIPLLPANLVGLPLRKLRLWGVMSDRTFPDVLCTLSELRVLHLRHAFGHAPMHTIVSTIINALAVSFRAGRASSALRELRLEGFSLSGDALSAIGGKSLRSLQLSSVNMIPKDKSAICLPSLTTLVFEECDTVKDEHLMTLETVLRLRLLSCGRLTRECLANKLVLHSLRIANCEKIRIVSSKGLPQFKSMRELEVENCPVGGVFLRHTPFLTSLTLGESSLIGSNRNFHADAVSLSSLERLRSLVLNRSLLSDRHVRLIPSLRVLCVNQCKRLRGDFLSSLRSLRVLEVFCSDTTDGGGFSRYGGLRKCRRLKELTIFAVGDPPEISGRVRKRLRVFKIR